MKHILIIGATSAIAEATARIYARQGNRLYLLARNQDRLSVIAEDLRIRGATSVDCDRLDATDFEQHPLLINKAFEKLETVDIILIAHGSLPNQKDCENDFGVALQELNTNAIGVISLLGHIANKLEAQRGGTVAVITSVAGDRGRQSNYVYGTAKGMISIFLQGLRNRLHKSAVRVIDVKPGFVDTPMTADFEKGPLWASPEKIGTGIARAIDSGKSTVYLPWFWTYIMRVIRYIPEPIFVKLKL